MTQAIITLDFESSIVSKEDVYTYLKELIDDDSLSYEVSPANLKQEESRHELNQLELPLTWG